MAAKAGKLAVRVRKRYCRGGLPTAARKLRVGPECSVPRVNLSVDDWIVFESFMDDLLNWLYIGVS